MVHQISFKSRENFCGSCFICIESTEASHCLKRFIGKTFTFRKKSAKTVKIFSRLIFVDYSIILLLYKYYNSRDCTRNATDYLAGTHRCMIIHSTFILTTEAEKLQQATYLLRCVLSQVLKCIPNQLHLHLQLKSLKLNFLELHR